MKSSQDLGKVPGHHLDPWNEILDEVGAGWRGRMTKVAESEGLARWPKRSVGEVNGMTTDAA